MTHETPQPSKEVSEEGEGNNVVLTMEVSKEQAARLQQAVRDGIFASFGVVSVKIGTKPDEPETE